MGASFGLHLVQRASSTPCSLQRPASASFFGSAAACLAASGALAASFLPQPEAAARRRIVTRTRRLRMSLAPFGRADNFQFRVALLALGLGQTVLLVPVAGSLEGRNQRLVAAGVHRLRHSVLAAPVLVRAGFGALGAVKILGRFGGFSRESGNREGYEQGE